MNLYLIVMWLVAGAIGFCFSSMQGNFWVFLVAVMGGPITFFLALYW